MYFLGVGYELLTVSYFGQRLVLFCSAKKVGKNPIALLDFFSPHTHDGILITAGYLQLEYRGIAALKVKKDIIRRPYR